MFTQKPDVPLRNLKRSWGIWIGGGLALSLYLIIGFSWNFVTAGWILTSLWALGNLVLAGVALTWGIFHPRSVLQANQSIVAWAIWVAILVSLGVPGFMESTLSRRFNVTPSTSLLLISSLGAFSFTLLAALLSGYMGAAFGALFSSEDKSTETQAHTGVTIWWVVQINALLITNYFGAYLPQFVSFFIVFSTPAVCWWLSRSVRVWLSRSGQPLQTTITQWTRRLVLRKTRRQKTVVYDFRGAALGLAAGLLALFIATSNVFIPLQTWTLLWLIQFRNAPLISGAEEFSLRATQSRTNPAQDRFVRLVFDDSIQRQMLTERSESDIQAQAIKLLKKWGATRIVLPLPLINSQQPIAGSRLEPRVDSASARRAMEDLPKLAEAAREAGNVILAIRRVEDIISDEDESNRAQLEERARKASGKLGEGVQAVGSADFASYHSARLPTMLIPSASSNRIPCAPWYLMASDEKGGIKALKPEQLAALSENLPAIEEDYVLVDFQGTRPGQAFLEVPYSSLLNKENIFRGALSSPSADFNIKVSETGTSPDIKMKGSGSGKTTKKSSAANPRPAQFQWENPNTFFKGKIVFLDSMNKRPIETPIGAMSHSELLVHAAATVWDKAYVGRLHPLWRVALILFLSVFVGHACRGLTPLSAAWRVAALCFGVLLASICAFLLARLWLEPVVPIFGMIGASALVTQLTFTLEKSERARNRALLQRFVAPQIVEELLDDPYHQLGLGGRRQSVCVLFADVRNFTPFASAHSPEEVVEVVNAYLGAMTEALHAHGGLLDKYLGDGLMALFRLGENPQEDIQRAVKAAIAMQQAAQQESYLLKEQGKDALGVGIGLHAGEAVVGLVGNKNQFNYTALGQTVILSQRLQSLAAAGEIVFSGTIYQAIEGQYPTQAGEETEIKGLLEPVRVYRLKVSDLDSL